MAIPRVFLSSTCYDLKHIRENLKYFVQSIGYEPVLSNEGDVYYDPSAHTHESCIKEVSTCQIFVLIIGGRYGGKFKDSEHSITNHEYKEAVRCNIPVFALIEAAVYSDHNLFNSNHKKDPEFAERIDFPSCDNIKIFHFIDEVRQQALNNAIFPFSNFSDMQSYLTKQWAGMMYDFLDKRADSENSKITNKLLDDLTLASRKSEELLKTLLKATDAESADKTIADIEDNVNAVSFFFHVEHYFAPFVWDAETLKSLHEITPPESWIDFLLATSVYHLFTEELDTGGFLKVLVNIAARSKLVIATRQYGGEPRMDEIVDSYGFIEHGFPKLEQSYASFKNIPKTERFILIESLITSS